MSRMKELAREIASHGTKHVFGVPGGGTSLELIDALHNTAARFHTVHFEGAAAVMAGATAKVSGRAGVSLSIKGPGLANMVPGLTACWFEGLPVVAIAEAFADNAPISMAHKRIDHGALAGSVVKRVEHLSASGEQFSDLASLSEAEEPGPVLLNLAAGPAGQAATSAKASTGGKNHAELLKSVEKAQRPIVIAGAMAARQRWTDALNALRIPVFTTAAAKGAVDETSAHAAGVYTGVGLSASPEYRLMPKADLVICLGVTPKEVLKAAPFHCAGVALLESHVGTSVQAFGYDAVIGCGASGDLFAALGGKNWGIDLVGECRAALAARLNSLPFGPYHAFQLLEQRFGGQVRTVLDTGDFCTIGEHAVQCRAPNRYLSSGNGRYMGLGLPMAVGAAIEDPSLPTAAIVGDGGIGPFVAELRTAAELQLPLACILMSDGGFGSIRHRAIASNFDQSALLVKNPSWLRIIEAMGIESRRVESETELKDALDASGFGRKPGFIEIAFDPDDYQAMTANLR